MPSKKDIEAQIAALQKDLETAGDEDFEVEIRDGDKSARVPGSKAADWLAENFGIGKAKEPAAGEGGEGGGEKTDAPAGGGGSIWGRRSS